MEKITVERSLYLTLLGQAAQLQGGFAGEHFLNSGSVSHPGDPFGVVIGEAARFGEEPTIMANFMSALRATVIAGGGVVPKLKDVLLVLPASINDGKYPDLDTDALVERLRLEVPSIYGE